MILRKLRNPIIHIRVPLLVCLVILSSTSASTQDGQQKRDETLIRLETELVQIDIVVTGRDGKPIGDLRREDFELFEDGRKQQITHFAVGTSSKPATWLRLDNHRSTRVKNETETPVETVSGRHIVLAVDDYHLAAENLLNAKRVLKTFVKDQMVAGDQVALVTTSGTLGMYQQFTNQRAILERAIDRLSVQNRSFNVGMDIPRISDYQAELIDRGDTDALELAIQEIMRNENSSGGPGQSGGQSGAQTRGRGGQSSDPNSGTTLSPRARAADQARSKARTIIAMNAHHSRATLETLDGVIRSLRPLTGRKIMVLLSDGFYMGGNFASQAFDIRRITDAATRAGVVLYSIDTRGLIATPPGFDASTPSFNDAAMAGIRARIENGSIDARRDGMNALAYDTGGFLVLNTNDLNMGLQKVLDDNEIYYVLAYEPPESRRDGRFHKIEVKIADREDLKVRTRKGYFSTDYKAEKKKIEVEKAEKNKVKSAQKIVQEINALKLSDLRTGISSLFPLREIPIDVSIDFIETSDRGTTTMLTAFIDAENIDFQQFRELQSQKLDFTVMVFNENGKAIINYNDLISLNLPPKSFEIVRKNGLSYRKFFSIAPGFYQARVAIREESTGKLGSASDWVDIPDLAKKKLTLSSILLSRGNDDPPDDGLNNQAEDKTMNPTTARKRFKVDANIDFMVMTYNSSADKGSPDVVIQAQVYSGSKLIYASHLAKVAVTEDSDLQRLPYAARISLKGFDRGEYELRLMAIDRYTKQTANRQVNFTVE